MGLRLSAQPSERRLNEVQSLVGGQTSSGEPLNQALGQPTVKPTVTFYNYALSELPMAERITPPPPSRDNCRHVGDHPLPSQRSHAL